MAQKRYYQVFGSDNFKFEVSDSAQFFLAAMAAEYPKLVDRAIRHGAYWLQRLTKTQLRKAKPGGITLKPLTKIKKRRLINKVKERTGLSRINSNTLSKDSRNRPYKTMVKAIGYQHKRGRMFARVGWLSLSSSIKGRLLQRGGKIRITSRQRRFFALSRVAISPRKRHITIPARPVFAPILKAHGRQLFNVIKHRIYKLMEKESKKHQKRLNQQRPRRRKS